MKILRIGSSGYEQGGIENGMVLMQPIFEKRGHIIKILTSDDRPDLPHFNDYTYKKPSIGIGKIFYSFNPYAYKKLKKVLKEFNPDIVHVHTLGHGSISLLFPLRNYPTVFTIHGPEIFSKSLVAWCLPDSDFKNKGHQINDLNFVGKLRYFYFYYVNSPLYWFGLRNVDVFVTLIHYMQNLIAQEGIQSKYVPNGTVLFEYKPLKKLEITNTLLYAGRLEEFKGVDYLISALSTVIEKFPNTRLVIAGDGSSRKHLETLTKKLRLQDNVVFLGHVNRTELERLYQKASIVVVPSIWPEAFGKIGIEAMSVGRPVVATDVGGISDWLIDGQNGFLVPPADSDILAKSVIKIFSDPEMFLKMAEVARKKAEEFDLNRHVERMEKIYLDLIKPDTKN